MCKNCCTTRSKISDVSLWETGLTIAVDYSSPVWMTSSIPELTRCCFCSRTVALERKKFWLKTQTNIYIYIGARTHTHTHANIKNPFHASAPQSITQSMLRFPRRRPKSRMFTASTVIAARLKGIPSHLPLVNDSPYASESIYLPTTQTAPIPTHVFSQSIAEPPRWLTRGRTLPEFGSRVRRIALGTISSRVRP